MEKILQGEPITVDMFPINQHPIVVLFGSGSLHSFIVKHLHKKHDQPLIELSFGYRILSKHGNGSICKHLVDIGL
jgi:hypothetical protein